jgi:hypothetical protein
MAFPSGVDFRLTPRKRVKEKVKVRFWFNQDRDSRETAGLDAGRFVYCEMSFSWIRLTPR